MTRTLSLVALACCLAAGSPALADNWPAWRGPTGQGICKETDLPLSWSAAKNVRWKLPLPGPGNSTPIVWEDKVFLTQATDGGGKRWTWCIDGKTGKVAWKKMIPYGGSEPTHATNPFCSASPVTDGERVIVSHGSAGLVCYDLAGKELWRRELGEFRHIWGNANTPVISGGFCYINCGPGIRTQLLCLDKKTGKETWKIPIPGGHEGLGGRENWTGSWSTPLVLENKLLVSYPGRLIAFEAGSGKELWSCSGLGKLVYTSPLAREGVAVSMSGFMGPPIAVRLGGKGEVTESRRLWRQERAQQRIGSGVIHEGHIYILNDPGVLECIQLKTGESVWKNRLAGKSWSSVVLSGDRLYTADDGGSCFVVKASPSFKILARNELGERIRASISISNGGLFIRSYKHLWCISKP